MNKYQPLVLRKLDIRIPGLHIRQLALHRHLPETTAVAPHAHPYSQFLLYLSGCGVQRIGGRDYGVGAGTAIFLPPRVAHAFRREGNARPICLVLDVELGHAPSRSARVAPLPVAALHEIRHQLALIARKEERQTRVPLTSSAHILELLDTLLSELLYQRRHRVESPIVRKLHGLLAQPGATAASLRQIARQAGYQHDYLNRRLKQEAGLTLGQMRSRRLLALAQQLLPQAKSIAETASAVGFNDPNYFTRWFHKHTGLPPSQWMGG